MLKNIKFKEASADILGIYRQSRVLIKWSIEPTLQNLNNLYFIVERGEAVTEMKQLHPTPIPANARKEFMDYTALLKDITKNYYYRIKAIEMSSCSKKVLQEFTSDLITLNDPSDLVSMYIVEEHLFAHQHVYGLPVLIYIKRAEGNRCDCWDEVLKRVTKSNCVRCRGVGFIGGYYPPIPAWMDLSPSPETVAVSDFGEKQMQQTDIQFTNYPNLQIGDLILQLKPQRYWRIENIRSTLKNHTTILQIARINSVNQSDIEYSLDTPQDIIDSMLKELRIRELTPEF